MFCITDISKKKLPPLFCCLLLWFIYREALQRKNIMSKTIRDRKLFLSILEYFSGKLHWKSHPRKRILWNLTFKTAVKIPSQKTHSGKSNLRYPGKILYYFTCKNYKTKNSFLIFIIPETICPKEYPLCDSWHWKILIPFPHWCR